MMQDTLAPEPRTGAIFSPDKKYRYKLWRTIEGGGVGTVAFVMLNPSTATGTKNDPTIKRLLGFARSWGFARLEVYNLYAFRTPFPSMLFKVADPIGDENDSYLQHISADAVVVAWGATTHLARANWALAVLPPELKCFGKTKMGHPRHPLYIPGDKPLENFR